MASETPPTFAEALRDYGLATVAFNGSPCSETAEALKKASVAFVAAERRRVVEGRVKVVISSDVNPNDGWS